jgi:hypothetical protein
VLDRRARIRTDVSLLLPFGGNVQPYRVVRPDTSFMGNQGYPIFLSVDFVYTIFRPNRFFEWNVLGGPALVEKKVHDGADFTGIEDPEIRRQFEDRLLDKAGPYYKSIIGLTLGTEFKYFFSSAWAFNFQSRYHVFNLGNIGNEASFKGNSFYTGIGITTHIGGHPTRRTVAIGSSSF